MRQGLWICMLKPLLLLGERSKNPLLLLLLLLPILPLMLLLLLLLLLPSQLLLLLLLLSLLQLPGQLQLPDPRPTQVLCGNIRQCQELFPAATIRQYSRQCLPVWAHRIISHHSQDQRCHTLLHTNCNSSKQLLAVLNSRIRAVETAQAILRLTNQMADQQVLLLCFSQT